MFMAGSFIVGGIAYATGAFGSGRAGLIAGLGAGSFSALTAILAPFFGGLLDQGRYALAFGVATVFPVLGFALWLWLRGAPESSAGTATTPR
jgi:ACS family hexuronate transporter-like MFS transporter